MTASVNRNFLTFDKKVDDMALALLGFLLSYQPNSIFLKGQTSSINVIIFFFENIDE